MVRTTQPEFEPPVSGETQIGEAVPSASEDQPLPAADAWLPNILLASAVVLLIVVVLGKSRRTAIAKSREVLPTPEERLADLRERAAGDAGIERRVAEAADQIRELTAVLDTRIETLDVLIQQADERIQRLDASDQTPIQPTYAPASVETSADGQKQAIYSLADAGHTPAEIAQRLGQHAGKVELILALRRV
ncbi:MAG: hypothetical protein AAFY46_00340 [Planctomycetota bacterium]